MSKGSKQRIFEIISKNRTSTPSELSRRLGITPQALHRHLSSLCQRGVLRRIGTPPLTRYELAGSGHFLEAAESKIIVEARAILGSHPAVMLVTLFGSVARGEAGENSDIDLLVWLSAKESFDRKDLWDYWDRQARHLPWANRVSIVTSRLRPQIDLNTLLLDFPEEHLLVFDRKNYFDSVRNAVVAWRERNGSVKISSFGGKHSWKYSTKATSLDEIDFTLEVDDVA